MAANPTTGAAITTINSGDSIDGGAGTDTLNITITANNNTSLSGLTVNNVEIVNVTGANNQNAAAATLSAATASKAATAAALTARQAEQVLSGQQLAAATEVEAMAGVAAGEDTVVAASTATTAAIAAGRLAAATKIAATAGATITTIAGYSSSALATNYDALTAAEKASFTAAQWQAAAVAATKAANGSTISVAADIVTRAGVLRDVAQDVANAVNSTAKTDLIAAQEKAAADYVAGLTGANVLAKAAESTADKATSFTALNTTAYTLAQYTTALANATTAYDGTAITVAADAAARATLLAANAASIVSTASDFTIAQLNSAATSALSSAAGVTLVTAVDDTTAIATRATALKTTAAAVNTAAVTAVTSAVNADIAAANALSVATTNAATATASISGSQFTGATQVWLVGAESNKTNLTVGAGQTAGLNGVTSLSNTTTFGTTGTLAVAASGGTTDIAGAASGLTITGTTTSGTTGLVLTNTGGTTAALGVKTLAVDMSGASIFDVSGMGQLTTVTIGNTGAVTINPKTTATKLASITTTGTGANVVRINTTTAIDDVSTTSVNETVNAVVTTGAGADTVRVATTGAGTTTVTTGAGNDTVYFATVGSGASSISTGEGNDTVFLGLATTLASYPNLTIAAGDGTDTLVMGGASFGALDYLRMNSALSGFETVRFQSAVGALDASKLTIGTITGFTFNDGSNVITEVGAGQRITLARQASVTATDFVSEASAVSPTGLNATAAGYRPVGGAQLVTAYGGALDVVASGRSTTDSAIAMTLKGASATVALSATSGAASSTSPAFSTTANLSASDLQSLTVNLTSGRGTVATGSSANAGTEYIATFNAGEIGATGGATHLAGLTSVRATGTGVFTINTGSIAAADVKLTTVDVSGMTLFANLANDGTQADTVNRSTTSITLNNNVAETVILGGADDTVATGSTVAIMDTITGFQVSGLAATPLVIDANRSDAIDAPTAAAGGFTKFTSTATTLLGVLTAAAATANAKVVFQFGGDTYVFADLGNNTTLDANDFLVKLTGAVDLDLLIQAGVLI